MIFHSILSEDLSRRACALSLDAVCRQIRRTFEEHVIYGDTFRVQGARGVLYTNGPQGNFDDPQKNLNVIRNFFFHQPSTVVKLLCTKVT